MKAVDREEYALAMLEADLHCTVLAGEVELTRELAMRCGIVVKGDDDEDGALAEEDEGLEDEEELEDEVAEERLDLPEERELMQLKLG